MVFLWRIFTPTYFSRPSSCRSTWRFSSFKCKQVDRNIHGKLTITKVRSLSNADSSKKSFFFQNAQYDKLKSVEFNRGNSEYFSFFSLKIFCSNIIAKVSFLCVLICRIILHIFCLHYLVYNFRDNWLTSNMNKNYTKSIPHLKICSLISYNFNTNKTQAIYEVLDNQLFGAPISRFFYDNTQTKMGKI